MEMLWWHWLVAGLLLAGLELLTPGGFYVLFFGVGAVLVGLMDLVGLGGPAWLQWLMFSFFSIVALMLFREPLLRRIRVSTPASRNVDTLAGELAVPLAEIPPGAVGRAELRGSAWAARNVGATPLLRGQRCIVERVDGLTILIRAEGAR